jgi:3-hydroxyisobutyrate dehydrogenase
MGLHMANNLIKGGFAVRGVDLSERALKEAEKFGIEPFDQIDKACKDLTSEDYIVTSLPKTEDVEHAMIRGVLPSLEGTGSMIIDTSTIHPTASKQFYKFAQEAGATYCDAPVNGGVPGAESGTLVTMVGAGSEKDFERSKILLSPMTKRIIYCGGPGTGSAAKISHNLILHIQMIATCEALALGEKLGINGKTLTEIL